MQISGNAEKSKKKTRGGRSLTCASPFINPMKVEQLETASNWRNCLQQREEL
jgi:hypothetical protein